MVHALQKKPYHLNPISQRVALFQIEIFYITKNCTPIRWNIVQINPIRHSPIVNHDTFMASLGETPEERDLLSHYRAQIAEIELVLMMDEAICSVLASLCFYANDESTMVKRLTKARVFVHAWNSAHTNSREPVDFLHNDPILKHALAAIKIKVPDYDETRESEMGERYASVVYMRLMYSVDEFANNHPLGYVIDSNNT